MTEDAKPSYTSNALLVKRQQNFHFLSVYRHYKGPLYIGLCIAHHHDSRHQYVLYYSLGKGSFNLRETWDFFQNVLLPEEVGLPRFEKLSLWGVLKEAVGWWKH